MATRSLARDGEDEAFAVGAGAAAVSSRVHVCVLGQFLLLVRGSPISVRNGGRTEAFLSALALRHGLRVPRETLLAEVWPDSDPILSAQALNSLVHSIHKLMGSAIGGAPPVLCRQGAYQLNLEAGVQVDVAQFDEYAKAGDAFGLAETQASLACYQRAIDLYRGDLCAGDDHYAVIERERLRARYLTILARSAGYQFDDGRHEAALSLAEQLLRTDPCREDAHRLVMRCYMLRGERAQAMRQFNLCARVLMDEFEAAPEPATIALFDQIRLDPASV